MKYSLLFVLLIIALWFPGYAQEPNSPERTTGVAQAGLMILSKEGRGTIFRDSLSLTLSSVPGCDQTQSRIPDGSKIVSESFGLNVDTNGLGTFYGTVKIVSPGGELLQLGGLRGTVGINACEAAVGTVCLAVCNRPYHLEGIYEPALNVAPNPNGQIVLAHFKADLDPRVASPLPIYQARLDGLFTPPPNITQRVLIAPEKFSYFKNETISVKVTNATEKTIEGHDLKSRCTILELQRQENDRWVTAGQCFLRRVSLPVNIKPGETLQVDLQSDSPSAPIPSGIYRLALVFQILEDEKVNSDSLVAFSPLLRISEMPQRGGVEVSVDSERYLVGQAIKVKVSNDTDRAIQTSDHQTGCTIVTMQRLKDGNWSNLPECPLLIPTLLVKIDSRQTVEIKLTAGLFGLNIEPAIYRIEFSYIELDDKRRNGWQLIKEYSSQFTVAPRE